MTRCPCPHPYFLTTAAQWLVNSSNALWLWDELNEDQSVALSSHISSWNRNHWVCKRQNKQKYEVVVKRTDTLKQMQILGIRPRHEAKLKWRLRHNTWGINIPVSEWMTLEQQGTVLGMGSSLTQQSWVLPVAEETQPSSGWEAPAGTMTTAQWCPLIPCCHQPTQAVNLCRN